MTSPGQNRSQTSSTPLEEAVAVHCEPTRLTGVTGHSAAFVVMSLMRPVGIPSRHGR